MNRDWAPWMIAAAAGGAAVATLVMKRKARYTPPKVWTASTNGGKFSSINRATAGARTQKKLPIGKHPYQLYSLGTPNGIKVTMMLEELCEALPDFEYDAWFTNIMGGDQFTSGFVDANPNSKIPVLVDHSTSPPTRVFESGSILLYLAQKHGRFLPKDAATRTECLNWLFWQMGSAPYLGGGFGHFYAYAPFKMKYPIDRFSMEVKRQMDVLDRHLANNKFMCGDEYSIADFAIFPWYGRILKPNAFYNDCATFLSLNEYKNIRRWVDEIEGTQRGVLVNRWEEGKLKNRHSRRDFEGLALNAKL